MERIVIIGCGGSGKSTLARQLGEKLNLPVVHLDKLFWRPGWQSVPKEEFDALLEEELEKPAWVMDGNFNRTIPKRLEKCDTVIYLDFPRVVCLWGVVCRIAKTYGKVRPDMGEGCPERIDFDFLKWVWNFNKENRTSMHAAVANAKHAEVYIFKNRRELKRFLRSI